MVQPWRASAAVASGAVGIGGHPVQGAIASPPGTKGGPHGDLAVCDVLAGPVSVRPQRRYQGGMSRRGCRRADFANNPEGQMELPGADIQPQRPFQIHGLFAL